MYDLVVIHYEWSSFAYFANLFRLTCLSKVQLVKTEVYMLFNAQVEHMFRATPAVQPIAGGRDKLHYTPTPPARNA